MQVKRDRWVVPCLDWSRNFLSQKDRSVTTATTRILLTTTNDIL